MTIKLDLNHAKAGELAAMYILAMRGFFVDYTPAEIQDALEALVGDLEAIEAIRHIRIAMSEV